MNAAAYIRVSSRAQTYETQVDAIQRAAAARGDVLDRQYEEKRTAASLRDRPKLAILRNDARRGVFRKLYVFRLDRLARGGVRDMLEIVDELRGHGVEIVTVADGFDLNGPAAEVVLSVLAWAAKMERFALSERMAAARERLLASGRAWGRPRRADAATIAKAVEMREDGRTIREIARALKIPKSTVARSIRFGMSQKGPFPGPSDPPTVPGGQ